MPGLEDAAVDAAAQVLDEGAEQAAVGDADDLVAIEQDFHGTHAPSSICRGSGGGQGERMLMQQTSRTGPVDPTVVRMSLGERVQLRV